jgi:hypothetical protein
MLNVSGTYVLECLDPNPSTENLVNDGVAFVPGLWYDDGKVYIDCQCSVFYNATDVTDFVVQNSATLDPAGCAVELYEEELQGGYLCVCEVDVDLYGGNRYALDCYPLETALDLYERGLALPPGRCLRSNVCFDCYCNVTDSTAPSPSPEPPSPPPASPQPLPVYDMRHLGCVIEPEEGYNHTDFNASISETFAVCACFLDVESDGNDTFWQHWWRTVSEDLFDASLPDGSLAYVRKWCADEYNFTLATESVDGEDWAYPNSTKDGVYYRCDCGYDPKAASGRRKAADRFAWLVTGILLLLLLFFFLALFCCCAYYRRYRAKNRKKSGAGNIPANYYEDDGEGNSSALVNAGSACGCYAEDCCYFYEFLKLVLCTCCCPCCRKKVMHHHRKVAQELNNIETEPKGDQESDSDSDGDDSGEPVVELDDSGNKNGYDVKERSVLRRTTQSKQQQQQQQKKGKKKGVIEFL